MAIGVGNLVSAADYNAIYDKINKVLGDDGSNEQVGYGRALTSSPVSAGDVIDADMIDNLYTDLVRARVHQVGSATFTGDGINAPDAGEYIGAFAADIGSGGTSADATADESEGFLDFSQAATLIDTDKYLVSGGQTSVEVLKTSSRTAAWNGSIAHLVDVVWTNANERRYFFNSGGYIQFDASLSGGNSVAGNQTATYPSSPAYQKDEIWQTMLNTMGSIRFSRTGTAATGSGTAAAVGAYDITSSYQTIFTKSGSGVYSENSYKIEARGVGGADTNKIRFRITFNDSDLGDNRDDDAGFPGEGTPVDENVTGTITSTVSGRAATGLGISNPSSETIATMDGSTPASYILSSTISGNSTDEGTTFGVTLSTTNLSNGTLVPYTVTGITAADLVSGSLTGNFNIQSNSNTVYFNIKNDLVTEGTETFELSLNNGEATITIDILDTSKTGVVQLLSSSASVDEGGTVTFTLNTENVTPGTQFAWSITGIDQADLSSGGLTGVFDVQGTYASSTDETSITLANDFASEGVETITFTAAGLSKEVTVNDTSAAGASAWPTVPLTGWGSNYYAQSSVNGNYTAQSFAVLNVTNDSANNRVTLSGYTGDNSAFATVNTGHIDLTGYSSPTIEVRYFQSNVQITSVGDEVSYTPATGAQNYASGTWYTIASNTTRQFEWQANELRYDALPQGQGGSLGASEGRVQADNVSFEVRISETGKPTFTRTSPVKSVNLTADLYTGQIQ
jgi:hypothetical protein